MLKELAYRLGSGALGPLGRAVRMPFGEDSVSIAPRRVRLVITVDTEGGYVEPSERRVWQGRQPTAFQGYLDGIRNITQVLDRHRVKGTFFVSPHGRSATGATLTAVERAIQTIPQNGHELGLHIHPSSDRALAERLGRTFSSGSARDLAAPDLERLVRAGRDLLEEIAPVGTTIDTFRWGNWALDDRAARIVAEAGFRVDSSAVPGLQDPRFDWSHVRSTRPWTIAPGLLEIPIAMFRVFGRLLRADPLYGPLVSAARRRYAKYSPAGPIVFVVMTHSSEATHADGSPTRVLDALDDLLRLAREDSLVDIVTLGEAAR